MEKIMPQTSGKTPVKRKRGLTRAFRAKWEYLVMILPGLIVLFVNNYLPLPGIVIAFKDYKFMPMDRTYLTQLQHTLGPFLWGILKGPWQFVYNIIHSPLPYDAHQHLSWLGNFLYLFTTKNAWIITRNTVLYNLVFIVLSLVMAVFFAIVLSELRNRRASKIYQSVMFLPYFLSWVVVSYLAFALFSTNLGIVNTGFLEPLGLAVHNKTDIAFYSVPKYWPFILTFFNQWKYTGYNSVVYLAAITAIDPQFYEAAMIDGASRWQRIRHVTLPQLEPLMIILTVLAIGRIFNSDFGLFYQVPRNQGTLFNTAATIDTYVYNALRTDNNIGMSTAAGLYQSIVGFICVYSANYVVRRLDREKAVF